LLLGRPTLSESESKELLAAWGVGSARERRANSAEAAVEAAERLGLPVALKVDSPDLPHKTEAGVVRLNLGDAAQVRTADAEILASAKAHAPQARIIGVSVQEMVGEGVEVIIGVSCDPQLGPVLLFGSGGVMVRSPVDEL
jgi:acetyltransferase